MRKSCSSVKTSAQHVYVYVVDVTQYLVAGLRCVVVLPLPSSAVYAPATDAATIPGC